MLKRFFRWIRSLLRPKLKPAGTIALSSIKTSPLGYTPDITWMRWTFVDGTTLEFKTYNKSDYWGGVPSLGSGRLVRPDGRSEYPNINELIRKGKRAYPYPPTVIDLGWTHHYSIDGKHMIVREDGLELLATTSVDLNRAAVGITAQIASAEARVEK